MRPYRGLTKDGMWVYGYYAEVEGWHLIIPSFKGNEPGVRASLFAGGISGYWNILPETVGQQIGRKDVNDKEIYEGDILYWCVYDITLKGYGKQEDDGQWTLYKDDRNHIVVAQHTDECEIIGDIHTTPELLEKEPKCH